MEMQYQKNNKKKKNYKYLGNAKPRGKLNKDRGTDKNVRLQHKLKLGTKCNSNLLMQYKHETPTKPTATERRRTKIIFDIKKVNITPMTRKL